MVGVRACVCLCVGRASLSLYPLLLLYASLHIGQIQIKRCREYEALSLATCLFYAE